MSSVNIDLAADTILNVMVGQQDENEVREVVFDFSDWYTTYGSGTISLAIQRPKDEWPYEGTLTVDNSTHKATWEISDTDSAYAGVGQIQLSYTVGTAVKKSVVYRFTVYKSLGALGNVITPIQIQTFIDEVTEALEDMQEELNDVKQDLAQFKYGGGGVTDEARLALMQFLSKVALIDTHGQEYYDTLFNALFPVATLTSITCVYTQSGTVYTHDSLNSLKSDLVVTAHYDDASEQTVTLYTLSGELTAGTSTITVSYGGKTTTFNVSVTAGVPSTYQMYDYVRMPVYKNNTGSTTWLSLKKYDNLNVLSCEFKTKATESMVSGNCIFGCRSQSGTAYSYAFYIGDDSFGYHLHGVDSNPNIPHTPGELSIVKYTNTASSPSSIQSNDNEPASIVWVNNNTINQSPVLFANPINGSGTINLHASAEIGYIKFFDLSENLISHYFPCVRKADNVIGMYDIIEQTFYTSSASQYSTIGNSSCYYSVGNWS